MPINDDWKTEKQAKRIAELEAEVALLSRGRINLLANTDDLFEKLSLAEAQLADLTGGLSVEEFKRVVMELQKNQKSLDE